tara:strand:- start:422 stop:1225 length:804 start_codon:yes stop_codon:yes gene_type:complete
MTTKSSKIIKKNKSKRTKKKVTHSKGKNNSNLRMKNIKKKGMSKLIKENIEKLKLIKKYRNKKMKKLSKNKKISKNINRSKLIHKNREKTKILKNRKNMRSNKVKVGAFHNYAEIGDKIYDTNNGSDLGTIIKEFRNTYITNLGKKLLKREEGDTWDILMYFIYILSINTDCPNHEKPYEEWPYIDNDFSDSNEILLNVVVSAPSEREARECLIENNISGIEDINKYGNNNSYNYSVWNNPNLTNCQDIGDSIINDTLILNISKCAL